MRKCPACGFFHFPKVGTCAVAILHDGSGERVLLDKRAYDPGKGLWALLGGYLEPNEDPVSTLHREVHEESGLQIEIESMLGIRVGGPTCGIFYSARVTGGDVATVARITRHHVVCDRRDSMGCSGVSSTQRDAGVLANE